MAGNDLLTRKQAAAYLENKGCAASFHALKKMAANENEGRGPPFIRYRNKKRNHIKYSKADLDTWAATKLKRVE